MSVRRDPDPFHCGYLSKRTVYFLLKHDYDVMILHLNKEYSI